MKLKLELSLRDLHLLDLEASTPADNNKKGNLYSPSVVVRSILARF